MESLGYFLHDKPRSVPESNPNSEDESKSEDRTVAKKGKKYCFREEWVHNFEFHEPQIFIYIYIYIAQLGAAVLLVKKS